MASGRLHIRQLRENEMTTAAGASEGANFGGLASEAVALYRTCEREPASSL
jgi:hypothetical protein